MLGDDVVEFAMWRESRPVDAVDAPPSMPYQTVPVRHECDAVLRYRLRQHALGAVHAVVRVAPCCTNFDRQLSLAEVERETIRVDAAIVLEALQHVCHWAQRCDGGQEAENRCTPAHRSQRSLRVINANVHLVHRSVRLDKAPACLALSMLLTRVRHK